MIRVHHFAPVAQKTDNASQRINHYLDVKCNQNQMSYSVDCDLVNAQS